ncbi:MAG: hypothetical protein QCI82_09270, partial [Candidatus Thermoplasmatota archaeon]|nr:hypothetical protein [Candidatus Thermoplasmatota archaeon]
MEQNLSLDDNDEDCDGDGLSDGDEVLLHGTDPLKADMDGDGLSDGFEVYTSKTDPLDLDSDDDGLPDALEYNNSDTGLDPNDNDVDKDGLLDGNPFEGVMGFDGQVKPRSEWLNSDEEFESILGDPFTYNFNDTDSDGDGLKDGYELGITDNHDNIIGDRNKSIISGDTDNDRIVDPGEEWLNTNPLNYDTDEDNIPDGWIDGWVRDKFGLWMLDKNRIDGVKDYHEGEGIAYDGTAMYESQKQIQCRISRSATKVDTDGDSLPDWLERLNKINQNVVDTDGDGVNDNLDIEPMIKQNSHFGFVIKSFFVMDSKWDKDFLGKDFIQGNEKADVYFTIEVQSRGTFTDEWKDKKSGGASIKNNRYPKKEGIWNDHYESYGSNHII